MNYLFLILPTIKRPPPSPMVAPIQKPLITVSSKKSPAIPMRRIMAPNILTLFIMLFSIESAKSGDFAERELINWTLQFLKSDRH